MPHTSLPFGQIYHKLTSLQARGVFEIAASAESPQPLVGRTYVLLLASCDTGHEALNSMRAHLQANGACTRPLRRAPGRRGGPHGRCTSHGNRVEAANLSKNWGQDPQMIEMLAYFMKGYLRDVRVGSALGPALRRRFVLVGIEALGCKRCGMGAC